MVYYSALIFKNEAFRYLEFYFDMKFPASSLIGLAPVVYYL